MFKLIHLIKMENGRSARRPDRGRAQRFEKTSAELAELVRDSDRIVTSGCGAAPLEFLASLAARRDLKGVVVSHATAWGALPHLRELDRPSHLRFEAYFLPALARGLYQRGEVDYLPLTFALMDAMYRQGSLRADVVAVTCSMPDADGYCSLGPFVSYLPAAMDHARLIIGECSSDWPRTGDAARVHVSTFDYLIEVARKPIPSTPAAADEQASRIAEHVLGLVPDGATIQIGRGAIPETVARGLHGRRDLGVHSEMVSDWVVDLCDAGALTGAKKATNRGRIVTSFMDGSERLYRFADRNERLCMLPIYDVNSPATVGQEANFIAINSAIEVDLSGQINAESIGNRLMSGSGGLLDFALGAARSPGGKFIVAMPSTAKGGNLSRIVSALSTGAAVTVPRALAHYVITEYGVADLRGCSLRERARRLIAIAHPKFREALARRERPDNALGVA